MKINLNIKLADFITTQITVSTFIVVSGLISYLYFHISAHGNLWGFLTLFDVGSEQSIPTYFSLLNLLLSSILLFIIYKNEKLNKKRRSNYWLFLSILFLLFSIDESAGIHEKFAFLYDSICQTGIIPSFLVAHSWLPIGVFFIVIIGFILIPFLKSLPKTTLFYFLLSAAIFFTGAIGFEFLGAVMRKTGFVSSKEDLIYLIRRIFEEGFEIYGIVIFNCGLYRDIIGKKISLTINS